MNVNMITALGISYELLPEAPYACCPQVVDTVGCVYSLKTRINFSLASGAYREIPTGIRILDFPELTMNATPVNSINFYMELACITDDRLLTEYGLRCIGPQCINSSYTDELKVIVFNESKTIFNAEAGDELALLTFNLKPYVRLEMDPNSRRNIGQHEHAYQPRNR